MHAFVSQLQHCYLPPVNTFPPIPSPGPWVRELRGLWQKEWNLQPFITSKETTPFSPLLFQAAQGLEGITATRKA